MGVEIIIASGLATLAISIAVILYLKEKDRSSDFEKLLKSAKKTIDEMKPIIDKQGEEIERNHTKDMIRIDSNLEKISYWFTLAKQNLFSTKAVFNEMHDLTKAVEILKAYLSGSKQISTQIEMSLGNISDLLSSEEYRKIENTLGSVKAYNDTLLTLTTSNYQEIRDNFPIDHFIESISELQKDLPDPHLEI